MARACGCRLDFSQKPRRLREIKAPRRQRAQHAGLMICCLFAAFILAPFGLWTIPKARADGMRANGTADCCSPRWISWMVPLSAFAAMGLCLTAFLIWWREPALFHAFCRTLPGF